MGYVLVENDTAVPYSLQQLRDAHPNTSFPKNPSAESLAEFNVFPLNYDPQPDFDIVEPDTIEQRIGGEGVDENGEPIEGFYGWWQSWTGRNRTPEEKALTKCIFKVKHLFTCNGDNVISNLSFPIILKNIVVGSC